MASTCTQPGGKPLTARVSKKRAAAFQSPDPRDSSSPHSTAKETRTEWIEAFHRLSPAPSAAPVTPAGCIAYNQAEVRTIAICRRGDSWTYAPASSSSSWAVRERQMPLDLPPEACILLVKMVRDCVLYKEQVGQAPGFTDPMGVAAVVAVAFMLGAVCAACLAQWSAVAVLVATSVALCAVACSTYDEAKAEQDRAQYLQTYGDAAVSMVSIFCRDYGCRLKGDVTLYQPITLDPAKDAMLGVVLYQLDLRSTAVQFERKCAHCDLPAARCDGVHRVSFC